MRVCELKEKLALRKTPQLGDDSVAVCWERGAWCTRRNRCEGYVNLPTFREPWGFVECVGRGGKLFVVGRCLRRKLFSCCGAMILGGNVQLRIWKLCCPGCLCRRRRSEVHLLLMSFILDPSPIIWSSYERWGLLMLRGRCMRESFLEKLSRKLWKLQNLLKEGGRAWTSTSGEHFLDAFQPCTRICWTFHVWFRPMRRHPTYEIEQLAISVDGSSWTGLTQDVHVVFSMHTYHPVEVETDYCYVE